jgi:hypothetical protein
VFVAKLGSLRAGIHIRNGLEWVRSPADTRLTDRIARISGKVTGRIDFAGLTSMGSHKARAAPTPSTASPAMPPATAGSSLASDGESLRNQADPEGHPEPDPDQPNPTGSWGLEFSITRHRQGLSVSGQPVYSLPVVALARVILSASPRSCCKL